MDGENDKSNLLSANVEEKNLKPTPSVPEMATKEEDKVRSTSRTEKSDNEDQTLPPLEEVEDEEEIDPKYTIRNAEFITSEMTNDWKKDVQNNIMTFIKY